MTWLVWVAPLVGIFAAGVTQRRDPVIEGDQVLRHDGAARITHWSHALGTTVLLVTGIALGGKYLPTLVGSGQPVATMMNVHFVAVVFFLFGTFYYAANAVLAPQRYKEHLPGKDAVGVSMRHFSAMFGNKADAPAEAKYLESEKIAYVLAGVVTITIIITGLLKVAAHAMGVPAALLALATPLHDIATFVMIVFYVPHILFAAILPMGWPLLKSMLTGYVGLDYAKHEHSAWVAELESHPVREDCA